PVVLYTTRDCQPCSQARSHLFKRGIPFAEKVVATRDDADAYRALGFGDLSFPAVSIGRQRSSGFEAGAWDRLLDTAGYPKSSLLTASYRYPAAEPLAAQPQQVAPPPEPAERAEAAPPARVARPTPQRAAPPAPAPDQPTIRF
ncbi:MAG TPA: glutaredoxin family protein, partial [Burkholderiaceae bacterium]|nr:glutaredoxin family protein [Burkholderiaceae bacterium]